MGPSGSTARVDLSGTWRGAPADDEVRRRFALTDFDDQDWVDLQVPGHWRSAPGFEACDGPVFHRRAFEAAAPAEGRRSFVVLEGCFYQGDVWLDGSYLGDTEGYFLPHSFEVTDHLRDRREHVLAVELTCEPHPAGAPRRSLTGMLQGSPGPGPDWNPGGIWRPVGLVETGPVRIAALRVCCTEASPARARLSLTAALDAAEASEVELATTVARLGLESPGAGDAGPEDQHRVWLTAGRNEVHWDVDVPSPTLWWPRALEPGGGPAALVDVEVRASVVRTPSGSGVPAKGAAGPSTASDIARRRTGLRQVRMKSWILEVNGEPIFLKGAALGPTRLALGEATAADVVRDVALAQDAGLDLLRVHAHIGRPELYAAADRAGLLLWQDLPLQGGYARTVRRQAVRQARAAVDVLAHHPSIALWCAHDEPSRLGRRHADAGSRPSVLQQIAPSWNRTILDPALARALETADASRPVVASSGVLPHPGGGTDTHASFGWNDGDERDLPRWFRRLPVLARFVGHLGAPAVPETAAWMQPERWPDLDWDRLVHWHGLHKEVFDERFPPAAFSTFEAWRRATQEHQATVLRHHIEALRRLKYRPTGGFCQFLLADSGPAVSASVLDHNRAPKSGYAALRDACAPVLVTADRPADWYRPGATDALDVHVVSDLRRPLEGCAVHAELSWTGGSHRWGFAGDVPADAVARVGTLSFVVPDAPGPLTLDLRLEGAARASVTYRSEVVAPSPDSNIRQADR